jgi:type III pantothenate kinase
MILLLDIGNTHTHLGLADARKVRQRADAPTTEWFGGRMAAFIKKWVGKQPLDGIALCSVVPLATRAARHLAKGFPSDFLELTARTVREVGIDYPEPDTIGPDRLANAIAVRRFYGAPAVVVDFGTAVTFDVVDRRGNYAGGIIAPGLAAMTDYLHEKTALLPRIQIREENAVIGKNTEQAMRIGAVHGYRGLVRELIRELGQALKAPKLPVVATGGYADLIARKVPEITAVEPLLTLEGLRVAWHGRYSLATRDAKLKTPRA